MTQIGMFDDNLMQEKSTDWKWNMANDYPQKNGLTAFSCFACGGDSTMGYKLAGVDVLGCCEIDPKMNKTYVQNHNPKYNYCMDIREFNNIPNEELPKELFDLDVLDGSPPCTTFSMAGEREESWGKKKKFREGQAEQTLDDLSFIFIETVAKLRPKVMIMENVEGLVKGEAWAYVQKIYKQLSQIGYKTRHWLLKGEYMGVPQKRHRVFFISLRDDVDFDLYNFEMLFNYKPILFGEVKEGMGGETSEIVKELLNIAIPNKDDAISDILDRTQSRHSRFNEKIAWDNKICPTLTSHGFYRGNDKCKLSDMDYINVSTFPSDYNYQNNNIAYTTCMSVPPIMIKRIMQRLIEKGLFDYKLKPKKD